MTTDKKYFCNICKDEIKNSHEGLSIKFTSEMYETVSFEELWKFDTHICFSCSCGIAIAEKKRANEGIINNDNK